MQTNNRIKHCLLTLLLLICPLTMTAGSSPKIKYPGGRFYIWRYTLKDKQGSPYSLEHPGRWLTHKSIERRRKQGLPIDSTDLPVSQKYLRTFQRTSDEVVRKRRRNAVEWAIIGTSRWNNTILVRSNDTILLQRLDSLE